MIHLTQMKLVVLFLMLGLALLTGCSKKKAPAESPAGETKQKGVSIDAPDASKEGQPAEPAPAAPPPPDAAPADAPAAPAAETLQGESELADWSYTLQDFVYRTKRMPRDITELATSVRKPVPRAPAGYKISFDKENQRVVLVKGN